MNKTKHMIIDVEFVCEGIGSIEIIPKGATLMQTYLIQSLIPEAKPCPTSRFILPCKDFDIKTRGAVRDFSIKRIGVFKKNGEFVKDDKPK